MVDETLILRKLSELEEYHGQIMELSNISVSKYQTDWKIQRIVERTLQMMIETCADISGHIISDKKYRTPNSYAESFEILFENKLLPKELFDAMQKMAKFRNIVVHHYDKVHAEIVVGILRRNLADFIAFKDAVIKALRVVNPPDP